MADRFLSVTLRHGVRRLRWSMVYVVNGSLETQYSIESPNETVLGSILREICEIVGAGA